MRLFSTTAVTITDPLVKYQTLVKTGVYSPDPAQHRLARHLRQVYQRIKDYAPQAEYRQRLRLGRAAGEVGEQQQQRHDEAAGNVLALRHHSIWRNPLFRHLRPPQPQDSSLALTRVLSNHETAMEIDSPRGLFLSGEVGTGKSMLLDLLADGLPTQRKRRWHFNTFMLYTFAQLERHRQSHNDVESLVWMASTLVDESPILFLDEFQLPDRAASKILSHLLIAFFQLGGVLVASSNRMPEELQKATGVDYARQPAARGLMSKLFGGKTRFSGELYGQSSDFAQFLDVLKARCDFWQMEGATDWRRRESATSAPDLLPQAHAGEAESSHGKTPHHYSLLGDTASFETAVRDTAGWHGSSEEPIPWQPVTLVVYGRRIIIPQHFRGTTFWTFDQLVESFGPADYISMASSYDTFIIDRVPVLTIQQKNEARRFITFLDALYEARCKLVIRAQQAPDDLFFPEETARIRGQNDEKKKKKINNNNNNNNHDHDGDDATYSETMAEIYQDQTSPFRPNISYYDTQSLTAKYDADQDSDFGPSRSVVVDFNKASAFTGEDERFAYKRATSRLWELCSASWHARTGDWWRPLPATARHWEGSVVHPAAATGGLMAAVKRAQSSGEQVGDSKETEVAGLSRHRLDYLRRGQDVET